VTRPPFAAPHHDASTASLVGGGSGAVRPGEISRAHCGVLLLDEFPLFRADVINALRQPLESGDISVARAEESVVLPARSIVVLAANPCPCGDYHVDAGIDRCKCSQVQRQNYRRKVTGPITDRIDITRHLTALTPTAGRDPLASRESSAVVRARVSEARRRQAERYAEETWRLNGQAPGPALAARWPLSAAAHELVDDQLWKGRLTRRGVTRVHRLAWTVADLAGVEQPGVTEVQVALRLRSGQPLLASTVRSVAG
jgi:magnesium chelatase family protein